MSEFLQKQTGPLRPAPPESTAAHLRHEFGARLPSRPAVRAQAPREREDTRDSNAPPSGPSHPAHDLNGHDFSRVPAHHSAARERLQRSSSADGAGGVPSIVHDVLGSPGRPLDSATRALAETRLGADLSGVRVHTGALAGESARAVRARAYTVGQSVVFAPGQFAPHTRAGERLMMHELTHTLQQRGAPSFRPGQPIEVGPAGDRFEAEAGAASATTDAPRTTGARCLGPAPLPRGRAPLRLQRQPPGTTVDVDLVPTPPAERERPNQPGVQLPTVSPQTWTAIGGSPYSTLLPGYSQQGDTCGAASLVTALIIWDREHWNPSQPNSRVVTACNLILIELSRYGNEAVRRWTDRPGDQVRRDCNSDRRCIEQRYNGLRRDFTTELAGIRDAGRQPGARISQSDYQLLGLALYFLWHESGGAGLTSDQITRIQRAVGLEPHEAGATGNVQNFDEIFTNSAVAGLQPDQFAQVIWLVNTGQQHAVLLGRLQSGEWFLSDQGSSPAAEFRGSSLNDLRSVVRLAATAGSYWLFTGTSADFIHRFGNLPGWLGATRLAPNTGTESQAQNIVPAGQALGEVDAGYTTIGNELTRDAFVARVYSLADAQARFAGARGGGLIVEMPQGVFSLYTTSTVSDANLSQTALDASGGGMLTRRTFYHAWLILSTSSGRRGSWFQVY